MKKSVTLLNMLVAAAVVMPATAIAAPSYLQRDNTGGYRVTYDYADHPKTGWYIGGNAGLSLLSWKNKYDIGDLQGNAEYSSDSYSSEPLFQGGVQIGHTIKYFWRAELEAGWQGTFKDKETDAEFTMHIPYMMLNGYYDFNSGVYLGLGAGVAMPTTTLDAIMLSEKDRSNVSFVGMGALYVGYSHKLDTHIVLDLRYRLAGMTGFKHKLEGVDDLGDTHSIEIKGSGMMDNSFTLGLRYEF